MFKYSLNFEKSKEVYEKYISVIRIKACYNNIANIVSDDSPLEDILDLSKVKVAFGGMSTLDFYVKHCFLTYEGQIIDPTIFTHEKVNSERSYVIAKEYDFIEYMILVTENNGFPDLETINREPYASLMAELKKENILLCG